MDLILCHTTADFDTLGAAVGLTRLHPGARVVLTGGSHPTVRDFLALHRDEYALIERRSVNPDTIRTITVVDTQWRDRLGKAAEWLDLPNVTIRLYDHHVDAKGDIAATQTQVEAVGSTSTLIAEQLQAQQIQLTPTEATVMALGIHVDTGSLTFDHVTVRDAAALTWLMQQGASISAIADYVEPGLSPHLQDWLATALDYLHTETVQGLAIAWVLLPMDSFVPGLSNLASRILSLTDSDVLLLAASYPTTDANEKRLTVIGRSRSRASTTGAEGINLGDLFQPWGGGGHARAASLNARGVDPDETLSQLVTQLKAQVPHPPVARELMSSPVRTIRPDTTIAEAQRTLLRYGHSGLSVVNEQGQLTGVISRRDLDIALHHGFSHAPVKGYMTTNLKTIAPDTTLPEIESLMVTYDIGRLPVLDAENLVGIVTRTDVLRQIHQAQAMSDGQRAGDRPSGLCPLPHVVRDLVRDRMTSPLWTLLMQAAAAAEQRGWQLYLVGGAVRDLLLANPDEALLLKDVDLVVDGFHRAADQAAGVELARALQQQYPSVRLQVHGRFQTAALLWHNDPEFDSLWIDIATARTEFYPYPAANPVVEASSIRQDLYRRDFTINALALRLTPPRTGELLDFFGGLLDLQARHIRVLHANSLIEDPTRIYRAVRFAVRLGFQIDPQTEGYIRHAIASGIYHRIQAEMDKTPALQTRLRRELKLILEASYWKAAIQLLDNLGALRCIHPTLELDDVLWKQLRQVDRCLIRFDQPASLEHWQVLLEVLLTHLSKDDRVKVAENLQLPADSIHRLQQLEGVQAELKHKWPDCQRPSQVAALLSQYDLQTLILLAVRADRPTRKQIWRYLTDWATVKAPLDGNDLKRLGYKPGKPFKQILDAVMAATLDGTISDRADAEVFVQTHFPKP
ncbi:CBS domain-containing protein [Oculatella sp. LEGE 06141]|uniref:CBS domain-containing protein n=1 Tax=Oculatella sp. LEGE 06141 TaxID=1828648 RepID=UPI00188020C6|nr:CBS domain-containing protein [Oculatella sp. LEGE 06141]MBE9181428.1 CBS domain-containing protein [Oculatella sp. LEGE 06141]